MAKDKKSFTGHITGWGMSGRETGRRTNSNVTVEADGVEQARGMIKGTLLPGERLVYTGPGERGHKIPPARG